MKQKNGSILSKNQMTKEYNPFLEKEGFNKNKDDDDGLISNDENKRSKNLFFNA